MLVEQHARFLMNISRFFLEWNQKNNNGDHEHDGKRKDEAEENTSKKEKYERKIIRELITHTDEITTCNLRRKNCFFSLFFHALKPIGGWKNNSKKKSENCLVFVNETMIG